MQLVVVKTKNEARAEFSKNLNIVLDRHKAPKRGRPEWLRQFLNEIVSRETCRKWLSGLDLPDEAHMSVLVDRIGTNAQFLRTGRWEPAPGSTDARFSELEKAWPYLDEAIKNAIAGLASTAKAPSAPTIPRKRRA